MQNQIAPHFKPLAQAFYNFDQEVTATQGPMTRVDIDFSRLALDTLDRSIKTRVTKIINTQSNGLPVKYANAWHWAGDWVKQHGVTLPPDNNQYRSLRNWMCFQVSMFKKDRLSARSKELLAKYKIDLSLYSAPNTGRGTLLDDSAMIDSMLLHYEITGSYDLPSEADPTLLDWQSRLLDSYKARGTSARMRAIESKLPGFSYGQWMTPEETPISVSESSWWRNAKAFRASTFDCPAYRGVIDARTPAAMSAWATQQITALALGQLSSRQRGELKSLGLVASKEHKRNKTREAALLQARHVSGTFSAFGYRERDLKSILGVALLVRLLRRDAPLMDIYSTLAVTPHQFSKIRTALQMIMVPLLGAASKESMKVVRSLYREDPTPFDRATGINEICPSVFQSLSGLQLERVQRLTGLMIEVRSILNSINVRQDIAAKHLVPTH